MTTSHPDSQRRRCFKLIAIAVAAAPLCPALVSREARAAAAISEQDPAAAALKYRADATKVAERKDAKAFCDNCTYYTARPGADEGACAVLGDRLVAAKGWCTSGEGY
jgi:hypothetical protein